MGQNHSPLASPPVLSLFPVPLRPIKAFPRKNTKNCQESTKWKHATTFAVVMGTLSQVFTNNDSSLLVDLSHSHTVPIAHFPRKQLPRTSLLPLFHQMSGPVLSSTQQLCVCQEQPAPCTVGPLGQTVVGRWGSDCSWAPASCPAERRWPSHEEAGA